MPISNAVILYFYFDLHIAEYLLFDATALTLFQGGYRYSAHHKTTYFLCHHLY